MLFQSLLSIAALSAPATANFYIFATNSNYFSPDGGSGGQFNFLNNPPSCDDINNSINIMSTGNDASSGGVACDGCDISKNTQDWDITRFEFYDGPDAIGGSTDSPESLTSGGLGHISTLLFA